VCRSGGTEGISRRTTPDIQLCPVRKWTPCPAVMLMTVFLVRVYSLSRTLASDVQSVGNAAGWGVTPGRPVTSVPHLTGSRTVSSCTCMKLVINYSKTLCVLSIVCNAAVLQLVAMAIYSKGTTLRDVK